MDFSSVYSSIASYITDNGQKDIDAFKVRQVLTLIVNSISDSLSEANDLANDYTDLKVSQLLSSAPGTLDTLQELAAALGNDPNFATTILNMISGKVDKVAGKGLSENDFTTTLKNDLALVRSLVHSVDSPNSSHPAHSLVNNDNDILIGSKLAGKWVRISFEEFYNLMFQSVKVLHDFDGNQKRLHNIADPLANFDAVNLQSVNNLINQAISNLLGSAPGALDTLQELAAALGNDPNFATTMTNTLAGKVEKIAGKGLSENDFTTAYIIQLTEAYQVKHAHSNYNVLESITYDNLTRYGEAADKAHVHVNNAILDLVTAAFTAELKLAYDDVVSRLQAKLLGSDIQNSQIALSHLTAALQQLIGSGNNITNYADAVSIESFLENSINKLRVKALGIDPYSHINWKWGGDLKGVIMDGVTGYISSSFSGSVTSFCFWIYPTKNNVSFLNFGTNLTVGTSATNVLTFGSGIVGTTVYVNNIQTTTLPLNKWSFVAITATPFVATLLEYGRGTSYFAGKLSNLFLYNRAFVAADYPDLFNNYRSDYIIPLVDEGAGNNDLLSGWSFLTGFTLVGAASITNATTLQTTGNGGIYKTLLENGKKYTIRIKGSTTATYFTVNDNVAGFAYSNQLVGNFDVTFSFTSIGTAFYLRNQGAGTTIIEVMTINSLGCVMCFKGENFGHYTVLDSNKNSAHGLISGGVSLIEKPMIQKCWSGKFTTNIAAGTANKDMTIPTGYMVEMIVLRNTLSAGNITNFQAVLNPASDNVTLITGKTINNGKTMIFRQLADCSVDMVNAMTLRLNATGNGTGGIDIMVLLRRKD